MAVLSWWIFHRVHNLDELRCWRQGRTVAARSLHTRARQVLDCAQRYGRSILAGRWSLKDEFRLAVKNDLQKQRARKNHDRAFCRCEAPIVVDDYLPR